MIDGGWSLRKGRGNGTSKRAEVWLQDREEEEKLVDAEEWWVSVAR